MNCAYEWYWMELQTWLQQGVPPTNAAWKEVVSRLEAASKMTVRGLGTVDGKCWEDPVQETLIVLLKLGRARFDPKKGTVSDFVFGILRKQIITHLFRPATKTAKRAVPFDESVGAFLEQKPIVTEGATDSDQSMDLNTLLPGIGHDPDAKRLAEAATTVDSREADIQISLRTGISRWKVRQIR